MKDENSGVNQYLLDFHCPSERLAIELDGEHHFTASGLLYDERRIAHLNALKINVIRFENEEVFQSPEAVLAEIKNHLYTVESGDKVQFKNTYSVFLFGVNFFHDGLPFLKRPSPHFYIRAY